MFGYFGFPYNGMNNNEPKEETTKNNEMNKSNCGCCQMRPQCPTIYTECKPIVTCSKQVIDQYHITKQPYIHTYHTEVVHHHITENEFIPNFTCSEVHINEPTRCANKR